MDLIIAEVVFVTCCWQLSLFFYLLLSNFVNYSHLYWSPKSGAIVYQIRMDDLTDDANPDIKIFWEDSSLFVDDWTVLGIDVDYSTSGDSDYIYWAVTSNQ